MTRKKNSDKEYKRVLKVWNKFEIKMMKDYPDLYYKFEMKEMKDYHELYLKCNVLLLADVLEKFRNNSLKNYGLCLSHYLNAPDLRRDAMLIMIKVDANNDANT